MLLYLFVLKLDFENTKPITRSFERLVDTQGCLSDLRTIDHQGQVKYLVPQPPFIDKLGFETLAKRGHKEDIFGSSLVAQVSRCASVSQPTSLSTAFRYLSKPSERN